MVEKLEDIFTQFGNKVVSNKQSAAIGQSRAGRLLPDRHPVRDFFVADLLDWALKAISARWDIRCSVCPKSQTIGSDITSATACA